MPPGGGLESWISTLAKGAKMGFLKAGVLFLRAMLIPKIHLAFENLARRQQLAVCPGRTRPEAHRGSYPNWHGWATTSPKGP